MAWAIWLAVPVAVTLLVAVWTWVRARPPRPPSTARAMREHSDYLDALAATARSRELSRPGHPEARRSRDNSG
ncbi:hypothetical protein [Jatrophihabitans endophyticus]|uniref:hypothetical protein n=1 Tax=Jatrophihabitans endophyticus TaxID=1206085 RepID=UPI0019D927C7|nr:hypothetical protein [Jatrophihabitans endophyticus]MBE7188386.1 hypothetical protein [Jatrophihabitans endophyticus]